MSGAEAVMPLIYVRFTHPNTDRRYHGELWEVGQETLLELETLMLREEVQQELLEDNALDHDSPISDAVLSLLRRGRLLHACEPSLQIDVYWQSPADCHCEDP